MIFVKVANRVDRRPLAPSLEMKVVGFTVATPYLFKVLRLSEYCSRIQYLARFKRSYKRHMDKLQFIHEIIRWAHHHEIVAEAVNAETQDFRVLRQYDVQFLIGFKVYGA